VRHRRGRGLRGSPNPRTSTFLRGRVESACDRAIKPAACLARFAVLGSRVRTESPPRACPCHTSGQFAAHFSAKRFGKELAPRGRLRQWRSWRHQIGLGT
jgi:hypothetical protein